MGKVYSVILYRSISDDAARAAYSELAGPAIAAFGGRVIARGLPLATKEQGLNERSLIIEWDSLEQAVGIYEDPAYQLALEKLGSSVERDIRILEAAG
jgi:uncharacterized protein (DUF1330 family)